MAQKTGCDAFHTSGEPQHRTEVSYNVCLLWSLVKKRKVFLLVLVGVVDMVGFSIFIDTFKWTLITEHSPGPRSVLLSTTLSGFNGLLLTMIFFLPGNF